MAMDNHTLVIGARGTGKTTLGRYLLEGLLALDCPVLMIDTTGDMTARLMNEDQLPLLRGFGEPQPADNNIRLRSLGLEFVQGLFLYPETTGATPDVIAAELHDLVGALIGRAGFKPKARVPEFALIQALVHRAWQEGRSVQMTELIELVERPNITEIGQFPVDKVISSDRRKDLANALAGLLSSLPQDSAANEPQPIDIAEILHDKGAARGTVLSFASGNDRIQKFHLAVLLAKLKTHAVTYWPDSDELQTLLYIDEASNLLPAGRKRLTTAPLLEILGGQILGLGLALVAEELSDLHEDVEDLCQTWIVARIPSLEARRSVVHNLDLIDPPVDEITLEKTIKSLPARHFVLRSCQLDELLPFHLE